MLNIITPIPPMYRLLYLILFLYTFLFLLIYYIHPYINQVGRTLNGTYRLPDLLHYGNPNKTLHVIHHWVSTFLIYGFVLFFLVVHYPTLLYYLVVLLTLKVLLRLFHVVTILPDSKNGNCHYTTNLYEMMRRAGSCNNLNISGHLISAGLVLYLISLYQHHRFAWLWIGVYVFLFFTTTMSHNHYTVDCLTSTLLLLLVITQTARLQQWIYRITGVYLELQPKSRLN